MSAVNPDAIKFNPLKFAVAAAATPYAFWYAAHTQEWHYIDKLDLLIHASGSFVFMLFGPALRVTGGCLLQCLMPALLIFHFCRGRSFYAAAFTGFWLGINFLNASTYAGDAIQLAAVIRYTGLLVLGLSTFFAIMFSWEAVKAPAPGWSPSDPQSLPEPGFNKPAPIWSRVSGFPANPAFFNKNLFLIVGGVLGLGALLLHGTNVVQSSSNAEAAPATIDWQTNITKAAIQANKQHKPVLLSFTGSDWCPACQKLDEDVLNTKGFKDYADQNLVLVELDFPQNSNLPEALQDQNDALQEKYNVHAFPTIIVLSTQGKILGQMIGCPPGGPAPFVERIAEMVKQNQ